LFILNQCTGKSIRDELQALSNEEITTIIETRRLSGFSLPVPKELHKMINFIIENGKMTSNIFLSSGNASS